jgi:PAS domain S-box-containing protein
MKSIALWLVLIITCITGWNYGFGFVAVVSLFVGIEYENFVYKLRSGEIVAVFENVTERKSHEQKLTVTLAKYRVLFDNFPLGISVSDSEGNILEVNAMSEKLLGISSIQHIHRKINSSEWRIIRPDGSPMPAEEFASVIALRENRLVENIEMGIVKPDNEITWISVTAAPVPLKGYGVVITYSDITEHRRSEQKVRALISEKEFLLMEANHRMKNNMNIINSLLILQAETMNEPSAKDALLNAAQRVRNLQSLYEKLFLLPGDSAMSVKDFLTGLVDEIISSFTESVDLRVVKEIDDFTLEAKKLQLLGIIINELLSNTMKYAFKGHDSGLVEVSASLSDRRVTVTVSDDGCGIPDTIGFHKSTGFGMMLVGFMTGSLDGEIRIERGSGTKIILEFDK